MRRWWALVGTSVCAAPAVIAAVQLAIDISLPPRRAWRSPTSATEIIGPQQPGDAPLSIALPDVDATYDSFLVKSVTWRTSPRATFEVCSPSACATARTAVDDWALVQLPVPKGGRGAIVSLRLLEVDSGKVGLIGSGGSPAARPVLSRGWRWPIERARGYFAVASSIDAFYPVAAVFLAAITAVVAIATVRLVYVERRKWSSDHRIDDARRSTAAAPNNTGQIE